MSSAVFLKYKSPVLFIIKESVPSCDACKSVLVPILNSALSAKVIWLEKLEVPVICNVSEPLGVAPTPTFVVDKNSCELLPLPSVIC